MKETFNPRNTRADRSHVSAEVMTTNPTPNGTTASSPPRSPDENPRISGLSGLFKASGEGSVLLDLSGRIAYASPNAERFLGRKTAELQQYAFLDLVPPSLKPVFLGTFQRVCAGQAEPVFETRWPDPIPGKEISLATRVSALAEGGQLLGININCFEVASRQGADLALRGDFRGSAALAEQSPFIVFFLDERGQCNYMNSSWTRITGLPLERAAGLGWLEAMPEPHRSELRNEAGLAHRDQRGWRAQRPFTMANGSDRWMDCAAAPVVDNNGAIVGYYGILAPSSEALDPSLWAKSAVNNFVTPSFSSPDISTQAPVAPQASADLPPIPVLPNLSSSGLTQATPAMKVERHALPTVQQASPTGPVELTPDMLLGQKKDVDRPIELVCTQPEIDKTTGLANRLLFAQHVAATTARMQQDALTVSLSFIHVHGLDKHLAEGGSRVVGDYLFLLSKRLEATIRSIEIAGRIDTHVFGVLSINWLFKEDLPILCRRLLGRLSEPLGGKDGREIVLPMHLGLAVAHYGETVDELFARARASLETSYRSPDTFHIDLGE